MKRLTKKYDGNYHQYDNTYSKAKNIENEECLNKLGKLEDIEEKLGVDLIILFKALKNGIWSKGGFYEDQIGEIPVFIERPEIRLCDYYQETDENYNKIVEEENVWCIYTYDYEIMVRQTRLKDYGKTWALTPEELKNE